MAQKTDVELTTEADVIGNETAINGNTTDRVRDMLTNLIDSKFNNVDDAYTGAKGQRAGITAPASLKDIVTTTLTLGVLITFTDSTASNVVRIYELTNETTAESSPTVIRPNDYATTTNEKVWRLRVTADVDSDTGGGGGGGDALVANPLSQFAATTSAQLAGVITDETGSGALVFANSPTLENPVVGTQSQGDNSTKGASTAFVQQEIALSQLMGKIYAYNNFT